MLSHTPCRRGGPRRISLGFAHSAAALGARRVADCRPGGWQDPWFGGPCGLDGPSWGLSAGSRRAFPHICEESRPPGGLQACLSSYLRRKSPSRRPPGEFFLIFTRKKGLQASFSSYLRGKTTHPGGSFFFWARPPGGESWSLLRSFDYSGRRFSHVGPGRQAPPPTELTKVSPG